ncbi:MAG TPA: trigger factor [Anaeromyxobacteraceae bacterium]
MKIEVEAVSPIEKKVTVEVDPARVGEELDRAYASLGRRVKLRGFRAGKVPRKVLERHFRDEVERDVVEKLVTTTFGDAVRQENIEAVAAPRVDVTEPGLQHAQPFRFTARVEVKPKLEPKDYKGLEAKRRPVEVTDQMVADELTRIQDGLAQLVPVEGRFEAQEGDYAVVDHDATVGGQPFEGGKAEGVTVRVGPGELSDGFFPQLAGKKLGEIVEVEHAFPADHRVEALRGKVAHFTVALKALKTRHLPSLDDELAKDVGLEGVDTLEKLRARIREDITKRERRRSDAELKDSIVKAALAKNDFEVPPALVERAIELMLQSAADRFARQGLDIRQMGLDVPRLRADLREQALLQVKGALLLEAIAEAEKIEVTEEDMQAEIARTAGDLDVPLAKVQQQMRGGDARAALSNRIREDKALALLTSEAKLE